MEIISRFFDEFRFLSNFYPSPVEIQAGGVLFANTNTSVGIAKLITCPTIEHAFQACKTADPEERRKIAEAETPTVAKKLGRKVALRSDWERVKEPVMLALLKQKFAPGSQLTQRLLDTGSVVLIEGNRWDDRYWGVSDGRGENRLGFLLMEVRYLRRNGD